MEERRKWRRKGDLRSVEESGEEEVSTLIGALVCVERDIPWQQVVDLIFFLLSFEYSARRRRGRENRKSEKMTLYLRAREPHEW